MQGYDALDPYIKGEIMTIEQELHIIEDMPQRCARWQAMAAAAKADLGQARDAARHAEMIFKRLGDECMVAKLGLEQARDAARHAEMIFKRLGDECMAAVRK